MNTSLNEKRNGLLALTPIMVMILLLVGFSVYYQSVASIPLLIVFIGTAIAAIASLRATVTEHKHVGPCSGNVGRRKAQDYQADCRESAYIDEGA